MTYKIPSSPFGSRPISPQGRPSPLQTTWAALSIIPFLKIQEDTLLSSNVSEWDTARRVCKVWKAATVLALRQKAHSETNMNTSDLGGYLHVCDAWHVDINTLNYSSLISLDLNETTLNKYVYQGGVKASVYCTICVDLPRSPSFNLLSMIASVFRNAPRLKTLDVDHFLGSPLLQTISQTCPALTSLTIDAGHNPLQTSYEETYLQSLLDIAQGCPRIRHFDWYIADYKSPFSVSIDRVIAAMPALTSLSLSLPAQPPEAIVTAIADSRITHLSLKGYLKMDASFLRCLKQITHLELLYADDAYEDFDTLDEWQEATLVLINACPQLLSLNMSEHIWMLNDQGLIDISKTCPNLILLDLSCYGNNFNKGRFSDAGYMALIQNCLSLVDLNLTEWGISDETRESLKKQYPQLNITI